MADPWAQDVLDSFEDVKAERDRLREDVEAAHWAIAKVRERVRAARAGDLTALFEEIDRLCLSFQQIHPLDSGPTSALPQDQETGQ